MLAKRLRDAVERIAATPAGGELPILERSISPLSRASSFVYASVVRARRALYDTGIIQPTRLPVPVVSVGNVTWAGNGKTPMVEFLAWCFVHAGINPVVLSRGYGEDEVRMLQHHFDGTTVRLGVGADRVKTALSILEENGMLNIRRRKYLAELVDIELSRRPCPGNVSPRIGVAILDDGMQHLKLARDLEIVMVNAVTMFGNERMIPSGPMRESLRSLQRAHAIVVHHANLVSEDRLDVIVSTLQKHLDGARPVFAFSQMSHRHFLSPSQDKSFTLSHVKDAVCLCVSGVGCPDSLSLCLTQIGGAHGVHRLDYPDHHRFEAKDMEAMQMKILELERSSGGRAVVAVTTEKDYFRHPELWKQHEVLVLCSVLEMWNSLDFNALLQNTVHSG